MTVTLTPLPSGTNLHEMFPNTDPTSGIITFTARPSRAAWAVTQSMLEAFGARFDIFGSGRKHDEDLALLSAWLVAYDIRIVVVRMATNLNDFETMDSLLMLCEGVGAELALTCDEDTGIHLFDWVHQHGTVHPDMTLLTERIDAYRRPVMAVPEPEDAAFPISLPKVDFYLFRARCRALLSSEQFEVVDALYRQTFRSVRDAPFGTIEEASHRLLDTCSRHSNVGVVKTIIRASQAAMFTKGILLKVDLTAFIRDVPDGLHRRLTPAELISLRAYRTSWRSCVIVLRDANFSRSDIKALRMDQVMTNGQIVQAHIGQVSEAAKVYLKAQRLTRISEGASDVSPFIPNVVTSIALAQRQAGLELGLPCARTQEPYLSRAADRWRRHLGVTMLPLDAMTLPSAEQIRGL